MKKITNHTNVPLGMAAYLAHDEYDFEAKERTISTTSIIKSIRQIILTRRVASTVDTEEDVVDRVKSRTGHAIHDGIERVWLNETSRTKALKALGWTDERIAKVRINPTKEQLFDGCIPIYMELRGTHVQNGWTISGKFDRVDAGRLTDYKSTSTYTYINQTNREKYILQGSIYRLIHNEIITDPELTIQYLFTDWKQGELLTNPKYPQSAVYAQKLPLLSIPETINYLDYKTRMLNQYQDAPESELPECTKEDLWQDPPKYKYYANPSNMTRSTKNFDNRAEADAYMASKGKGIVITAPSTVRACNYCLGRHVCSQYARLVEQGLID